MQMAGTGLESLKMAFLKVNLKFNSAALWLFKYKLIRNIFSCRKGGAFSAISCPTWWGICRFLHAIKTNPHLYPGRGGGSGFTLTGALYRYSSLLGTPNELCQLQSGGTGSPSHDTAHQSSVEFFQIWTEPCHNLRLFAGFHLVATSIWFIVVASRLVVSSVHALRKM